MEAVIQVCWMVRKGVLGLRVAWKFYIGVWNGWQSQCMAGVVAEGVSGV